MAQLDAMKIIFVGGTGRCGKSVVAECLARHPDAIKLPFELRFLTDPDGLVDFYASSLASWSPFLVDKRIKRLGRLLATLSASSKGEYTGWQLRRHLPNWDQRVNELIVQLYDLCYVAKWVGMPHENLIYHAVPPDKKTLARILGTFIRAVVRDFLHEHGKSVFVSDDTWSILFARELSEILPEAQFVHVYRDPRDVISSMSRQAWCPKDLGQAARYYLDIWNRFRITFCGTNPARYLEMKFEDFIDHPCLTFDCLCRLLDIRFDEMVLEPLDEDKAHIGRWKDESDQEAFEMVMPLVRELGYE
jgi:hypothetical protein